MNITYGLGQAINDTPTVLTIGTFDGIHRGHKHLIGSAVERARALGCQGAVLTFETHPDLLLHAERAPISLASSEQNIRLIAACDVDQLLLVPFNEQVKSLSAYEFIQQLCATVVLRELWVGYDFALGRKREGDLSRLRELGEEFGFSVHPVDALLEDGAPISSTRIRAALDAGDIALAQQLLGHPFELEGTVVGGDQRGRTIGFPTANIATGELQYLPANGVYVCQIVVRGETYGAVTNVGTRPTFDGVQRRIEAHIFDFDADIYGETVQLSFLHWLRGEQKFNGIQELIAQIRADAETARTWLQTKG